MVCRWVGEKGESRTIQTAKLTQYDAIRYTCSLIVVN